MKRIRVMIIDDERSARDEIRRLLEDYPCLDVIAEAKNADEAKVLIEDQHPDVLFLDIQMPEKSGFDLLESLPQVPQVVFITAFDQYAVKAFEISALDYLMKPVRTERFARAIAQVRQRMAAPREERIFIKDRNQYHFINWSDVFLVESMDNYARLYFGDKKVFIKSSLIQLEQQMSSLDFFRANRAQLINLRFVDKIKATAGGKPQISLKTGDIIAVSERQWIRLKNRIGIKNKDG